MTDPVMEGLPFKQYGSHTFLPFSLGGSSWTRTIDLKMMVQVFCHCECHNNSPRVEFRKGGRERKKEQTNKIQREREKEKKRKTERK